MQPKTEKQPKFGSITTPTFCYIYKDKESFWTIFFLETPRYGDASPTPEITELLGHAGEATGLECSTDSSGLSYCGIHGADE